MHALSHWQVQNATSPQEQVEAAMRARCTGTRSDATAAAAAAPTLLRDPARVEAAMRARYMGMRSTVAAPTPLRDRDHDGGFSGCSLAQATWPSSVDSAVDAERAEAGDDGPCSPARLQ